METLTDTYTLRVVVNQTEDGNATATVSAVVEDGRSCGPYVWEETREDVDPLNIGPTIVAFVAGLRGGKRLHPDA